MIDKKRIIYKIIGGIFYLVIILVLSFICWKMEKRVLSVLLLLLPISQFSILLYGVRSSKNTDKKQK